MASGQPLDLLNASSLPSGEFLVFQSLKQSTKNFLVRNRGELVTPLACIGGAASRLGRSLALPPYRAEGNPTTQLYLELRRHAQRLGRSDWLIGCGFLDGGIGPKKDENPNRLSPVGVH